MSDNEFSSSEVMGFEPGIQIRQRIKITQNAKGDYQKEISIEISGELDTSEPEHIGDELSLSTNDPDSPLVAASLEAINRAVLQIAERSARESIDRMVGRAAFDAEAVPA